MTLKIKKEVLPYISTSAVLLVVVFSYTFHFKISDMLMQLGVPTSNKINHFYGYYCIYNLFIPFLINYISLVVFKKDIIRILLIVFVFVHIIWLVLFIICLVS